MKNEVLLASVIAVLASSAGASVLAQRSDNPNLKMFYMARQQVQITDDVPVVNDMRTNPAPAQQSGAAAAGAAGQGLPRAGFASNMNAYHGGPVGGALPKVNNGVPTRLPEAGSGGNKGLKAGNAGKLKMKSAPGVQNAGPAVAKSYKPYATAPAGESGGGSGNLLNSSTSVKGSVLHWNKHH